MHIVLVLIVFVTSLLTQNLFGKELTAIDEIDRKNEAEKLDDIFTNFSKFYEMPKNAEFLDITEKLLKSPNVRESNKIAIRKSKRRILIFQYPSDGLKIKGVINYIDDQQDHPVLVYLRGGNGIFGIVNPASEMMLLENHTVISTMYRGGVSEGVDEFGGSDVNDVKNLIEFIPMLERKIGINIKDQKKSVLGASRGGMQMFLALARFPELQSYFSKAISLSGILDIGNSIIQREDMESMFVKRFGLQWGVNAEEWVNARNPYEAVDKIDPKLPILILQGTKDNRIGLQDGYNMVNKLEYAGHDVTYWEIKGGNHCLTNVADSCKLILNWLE